MSVSETTCSDHPDYHATVRLEAKHGDTRTVVEGTLFDRKHPRLVRINDYKIEATLDGHLLISRHEDQPGVVAAMSTILAEENINISRMQLGDAPGTNKAIVVIQVSEILDSEMVDKIADIEPISKVMQVSM
jgi:D-3-phosphoglycerate dehydrogenase